MNGHVSDKNDPLAQERLRRRRAFAEMMMEAGIKATPKTIPEGINSFAKSIAGALMMRGLDRQGEAADPVAVVPSGGVPDSTEDPYSLPHSKGPGGTVILTDDKDKAAVIDEPGAGVSASDGTGLDAVSSATVGEAVDRAFIEAGLDGTADNPRNATERLPTTLAATPASSKTPDEMQLEAVTDGNGSVTMPEPLATNYAPYSMHLPGDDVWSVSADRIDTNPFVSDGEKNVAKALLLKRYYGPAGAGEASLPIVPPKKALG